MASDGICLDAGCYFACAADNGCPPKQFCSEGQCLPLAGSENECTFNGECGPSMLCIEGTCFDSCSESLECGAHETCDSMGLCVADTSPVIQCSGAGSCAAGEGCFDGKCLPTCGADPTACSDTQTCEFGYCHQNVYCLNTADCADHSNVCLDGLCQTNPFQSTPN